MLPLSCALAATLWAAASAAYRPDAAWPGFSSGGATQFSAVAVAPGRGVFLGVRNTTEPAVWLVDPATAAVRGRWGDASQVHPGGLHGLVYAPGAAAGGGDDELWVADVGDHSVKAFTPDGRLLRSVGTRGHAGSGLNPLQFGNVADIALTDGVAYFSDGDGGVNNRVVAVNRTELGRLLFAVGGNCTGPGQFSSPHSVAWHAASGTLLVADRGNNRVVQLAGADGRYLGEWGCVGQPWGVRLHGGLALVADGLHQQLYVLDASRVAPTGPGPCTVVQQLDIPEEQCHTPHLLDVDPATGDVYVCCVANPNSNVLRFVNSN